MSEEMLAAAAARTGNEPSNWAEDQARFSVNMGIMRQTYANFYPDTVVTRAEAVYALSKIDNKTLSSVSSTGYSDVSASNVYAPAIVWAKNNGIASGYDDGKFKPGAMVTRQEMAVMVYRYLKNYKKLTLSPEMPYPVFGDDSSIADWAITAVKAICRVGIMAGHDDGKFKPENSLTRAEGAVMYTRIHAYVYNTNNDICLYVTDYRNYQVPYAYAFFFRSDLSGPDLPGCMRTSDGKGIIKLTGVPSWAQYGVNIVGTVNSAALSEPVKGSRSYIFVHMPVNVANGVPGAENNKYPTYGWDHNPNLCIIKHDLPICYAGIMNQCQNFGWRYLNGKFEYHQGLDYSYKSGDLIKNPFDHALIVEDVLSPADSEKTKSDKGYDSYGYYIMLYSDIYDMHFTFQHLSDVYFKTIKGTIAPGTVFCATGNSGYGFGAHLHVTACRENRKYPQSNADRVNFRDPRIYLK